MSLELLKKVSDQQKKSAIVDVRSGDKVRVHQRIKEGAKERVQVFEGVVIKITNKNTHMTRIWVRKTASGVGVEKSFLMHSPLVEQVEIIKRSKVRRNYLSYLRERQGKGERLKSVKFDRVAVNELPTEEPKAETETVVEVTAPAETK